VVTISPHGIKKPRRKHPSALFPESEVSRGFVARIHEMVGPRLTYRPVAQLGSGHDAWCVVGPLGRGLLVESNDGAQPGGTYRTRSVFIGNSWSAFPLMVGTVAAHGWDAGVAAEQGEPIPKMSDRRRYRLRDERTAEVAARLDAAAWSAWDPSDMTEAAGAYPVELLVELMNTFVMASPPPSSIERSEGFLLAYFSCRSCDWWGRGAALVERLVPGDGTQLLCPACETVLSIPTDQPDDRDRRLS